MLFTHFVVKTNTKRFIYNVFSAVVKDAAKSKQVIEAFINISNEIGVCNHNQ
jgi:hypothetical protein